MLGLNLDYVCVCFFFFKREEEYVITKNQKRVCKILQKLKVLAIFGMP